MYVNVQKGIRELGHLSAENKLLDAEIDVSSIVPTQIKSGYVTPPSSKRRQPFIYGDRECQ